MTRSCPACGFEQETRSESGKCHGCGYQLDPHPDHRPPAPGVTVRESEDPYVVSDDDVAEAPELAGVVAVNELDYTYGRGIGAEPYGYLTTNRVITIGIAQYRDEHADGHSAAAAHLDENDIDACPECGSDLAKLSMSQDKAGIAGGERLYCIACEHTIYKRMWS